MRGADTADVGQMDHARIAAPRFRLKKNGVGGSVGSANLDFLFYYCNSRSSRRNLSGAISRGCCITRYREFFQKTFRKGAHCARVNFREEKPNILAQSQ